MLEMWLVLGDAVLRSVSWPCVMLVELTGDGVEPVAGGSAPHHVRIGPDGLLLAGSPGFLEARSSRPS